MAAAVSDWVLERGGLLTREDLAAYEVVEREPARVTLPRARGAHQSAALVGRHPDRRRARHPRAPRAARTAPAVIAEVIASTNRARDADFLEGLGSDGYLERFLAEEALDTVATEVRSRLGNTTHVSVMDADGACASVTCSNGSCSGVVVPGTGMHLNNMLGEQDLNPLGFHRNPPGARVPSMMAPTVVLRDGRPELALGSAGSNRIRSAILQTVLAVVDGGARAEEAVTAPRLHVEGREVDAEPGIDPDALDELEQSGWTVRRWEERNLFFGGVQAVAPDPHTGELTGAGDPRRGGAAVSVG